MVLPKGMAERFLNLHTYAHMHTRDTHVHLYTHTCTHVTHTQTCTYGEEPRR